MIALHQVRGRSAPSHQYLSSLREAIKPKDLAKDLQGPIGPVELILAQVDPLLQVPCQPQSEMRSAIWSRFLTDDGLLDERAHPENLTAADSLPKSPAAGLS